MNTNTKTKTDQKFSGTIIIIVVLVLIIISAIFFLNSHKDKEKNFINSIIGINYAAKKSANLSMYNKVDIKSLPKTLKLNDKEYVLDYSQEFVTIKNFNDKELCNRTINIQGVTGVYVTSGIKSIITSCENNNMLVELDN